jgi:hypothetical protein
MAAARAGATAARAGVTAARAGATKDGSLLSASSAFRQ